MKKRKSKKKVIIIVLCIIVAIILGMCTYGYYLLNKVDRKKLPKTNAELGIVETTENNAEKKDESIVNIALFGLDARDVSAPSRSDSIMVVSLDSKNEKVKVTSLMRDMYVPVPDHEKTKINHSYAYGGPALAVKTINSNFGLDIRNYVTVNFFGLEKLIDEVGGVEINVSDAEAKSMNGSISELNNLSETKVPFVKGGTQTLNGRQAVAYSRIRHVGNSDFERTERQRTVLNGVFSNIKKKGAMDLPGVVTTILPYVETSLSNIEILDMSMKAMKFNTNSIEQFRIPVDGSYNSQNIGGMAVLVPNMEENKKKLHEFIYQK